VKLKLDENLGLGAAELLRSFGHDVSTVRMQGLQGAPDEVLFVKCVEEARGLVTLDHDFGHVLRFEPSVTGGIAILELGQSPNLQSIMDRVSEFAELLKVHPFAGRLWIVEPGRVRIHLEGDDE
jgi:predicted nuclease of predicted toxin-antitoxin system